MTDTPPYDQAPLIPLWIYRLAVAIGVGCVWAALAVLLVDAGTVRPDGRTDWDANHSPWLLGWTTTAIAATIAGTLTAAIAVHRRPLRRLPWLAATVVLFLIALLGDVIAAIELSELITT